jgi:hypothetical protein
MWVFWVGVINMLLLSIDIFYFILLLVLWLEKLDAYKKVKLVGISKLAYPLN